MSARTVRSALLALAALAAAASFMARPAAAGSLVAARAIPAKAVIGAEDVRRAAQAAPGAVTDPVNAVGREARVTIFEGRPIRPGDLAAPALVERNDIVRLRFAAGPLEIAAGGRALDRGAAGERIRVMTLGARSVVSGVVETSGMVRVTR